jgi:hypothetical protein
MSKFISFFKIFDVIKNSERCAKTTQEILDKLNENSKPDEQIETRTLQRHLKEMFKSDLIPLTCTQEHHPRWYWKEGLQFPMMTLDEALVFKMTQMFVDPVLPKSVSEKMSRYFTQADNRLKHDGSELEKKFRVVLPKNNSPFNQILSSLPIIIDSFVKDCQLHGEINGEKCVINPLGVIVNIGVCSLVYTLDGNSDVKLIPCYSISEISILENNTIVTPEGFDFDEYKKNYVDVDLAGLFASPISMLMQLMADSD